MAQPYTPIRRSAYNSWVPQSNVTHNDFVEGLISSASDGNLPWDPAVTAFDKAVTDAQKKLFEKGLVKVTENYKKWMSDEAKVKDWKGFLDVLNVIVQSPPKFHKAEVAPGVVIGEPIGVPLYLVLDLLSNTSPAFTLFQDPGFNKALKALLICWGCYLRTKPSAGTLNKDGWFSEQGLAVLEAGLGKWSFDQTYLSDSPKDPKEFHSWDSFFTRNFKPENPDHKPMRPVECDPPGGRIFVNNACESTVLRFATNVQIHDTYWIKEQNYSIYDMLGGNQPGSLAQFAGCFEGGSVYQAFLGPQDYHRWHSPVQGEIVASNKFDGTYYAVLPDNGAPPYDTDLLPGDPHGAMVRSQPFLSVIATRAVYIIKPDPALHLKSVAFIAIGMVEVSTCEITKPLGKVEAGEKIGMFHFGGSSHTLLLKPEDGYEIVFQDYYETPVRTAQHRWVNSAIAQVKKKGN